MEELTSADLHDGEQSALEAELALLENADRIGEALTELRNALDEDERGVLVRLRNAETAFGHLRTSCPAAAEIADRLRPVVLELKDLRDRKSTRLNSSHSTSSRMPSSA